MANQTISQCDPLTDDLADDDLLVIVDSSDLTDSLNGTTKRMDAQQIIAKKIKTTTGPTVLAIGAVADGEYLRRSGSTLIGDVPSGTGTPGGTSGDFQYNDGAGGFAGGPLNRLDANTTEQYNGTTNQVHRIYATRTSSTNYEALKFSFDSGNGAFKIEAEKGSGGGSFRRVFIVVSGGIYQFNSTSFVPPGDDATSLGSGSNYWNEIYGDHYILRNSSSRVRWAASTRLIAPANGILRITDDNENAGSGTLQFDARTPSQLTSNQNNYAVTVPGYFIRLSTDASRDVTGLIIGASNRDGQVHRIVNVGTNPLNFPHDDANSTASNRIYTSTGATIVLNSTATVKEAADIIYDGALARWLMYKL